MLTRAACVLLGHAPAGPAIWNHGYGFAHCRRCERAIMRAVFGGWRLPPRGYRIAWVPRDARPGGASPERDRLPQMPAPADRWTFMAEAKGFDWSDAPHAASARAPFIFDDFMSDDVPPAPARPETPPSSVSRRR